MAEKKETYTANMGIKTGGVRYKPGEELDLTASEAKTLGTAVQKGGKAKPRSAADTGPAGGDAGNAGGTGGGDPLDPSLFTPAALAKAREFGITDMGRTKKTTADGAKWGVEDVERRHEKQGDDDE